MSNSRRLAKFGPALALLALAVPSAAFGQATRTWVSGTGDDANPCSRTAPCKTFQGAFDETADGGEIDVLDSGGFGGVTITRSVTIRSDGFTAGVLVAGTNGIVVNPGAGATVTLHGLDVRGFGTGTGASLNGIKIHSGKSVRVEKTSITGFKAGINLNPTTADTDLTVRDSDVFGNGVGIFAAEGNGLATGGSALIERSSVENNTCGVVVADAANSAYPDASSNCGGTEASFNAMQLRLFNSTVANNDSDGVLAYGSDSEATIGC